MSDRVCIRCGKTMLPVKNGFWFIDSYGEIRTSDLWGCFTCRRFQIHGSPIQILDTVFGILRDGDTVKDPGNDSMTAVLEPKLEFTGAFRAHIKDWYTKWEGFI